MTSPQDAYYELSAYSLGRGDSTFIHQHVVDAFAAQSADAHTKPIALTFALAGLYLHVEKQRTGRYVQRAHATMARRKRTWPTFVLPAQRGSMTPADVMRSPEGVERDAAIDAWCAAVWSAYRESRLAIMALLAEYGID